MTFPEADAIRVCADTTDQLMFMQAARSYFFSNSPVRCRFTNVVLPARAWTSRSCDDDEAVVWKVDAAKLSGGRIGHRFLGR